MPNNIDWWDDVAECVRGIKSIAGSSLQEFGRSMRREAELVTEGEQDFSDAVCMWEMALDDCVSQMDALAEARDLAMRGQDALSRAPIPESTERECVAAGFSMVYLNAVNAANAMAACKPRLDELVGYIGDGGDQVTATDRAYGISWTFRDHDDCVKMIDMVASINLPRDARALYARELGRR